MLIESKLGKFPGEIELPDAEDWTLPMFDSYQKLFDKLARKHPTKSVLVVRPFAAAQWMLLGNGTWSIENITLEEFAGGMDDPEANAQLIFWFSKRWSEYFNSIIDPNG